MIVITACICTVVAYAANNIAELYENWDLELKEYTYNLCIDKDLDYDTIIAVIYNESRFLSDVTGYNTNGTKDYGLMQINDSAFDFLNKTIGLESMADLYDPKTNILAGTTLMEYHIDFTDDVDLALLRYQIGEGAYSQCTQYPSVYSKVLGVREEFTEYVEENGYGFSSILHQARNNIKKFYDGVAGLEEVIINTD